MHNQSLRAVESELVELKARQERSKGASALGNRIMEMDKEIQKRLVEII